MKLGVFLTDYKHAYDLLDRMTPEGLILVQNGVYHATIKQGGKPSAILEKTSKLYVLSEDMAARGLSESDVDSRVKVVDFGGLVDVMFNDFEQLAWL